MNSTQIENCLKEIYHTTHANEVVNTWIDMTKVAFIYLDQDVNIYPDKKHVMFFFDTTNELLRIRTGKIVGGNFVFDSQTDNHLVSFKAICGFIQTSKVSEVGTIEYVC